MPPSARLKISISSSSDQIYDLALRYLPAGAAAWQGPWQAKTQFDLAVLRALEQDMDAYGLRLSESLFADPGLREAFAGVWASAMSGVSPVLRLQLEIAAKLTDLHGLRWESLRHPIYTDTRLCASQRVHFSRLLHSQDWRPVGLAERGELEAVVFVANPSGLGEYGLVPINKPRELERARGALTGLSAHELPGADGLPTLEGLIAAIKDVDQRGKACLVYLVCHGTLTSDDAYLCLEDAAGGLDRVSGDTLVTAFKGLVHSPLLVALVSCESAADNEGRAFAALGPRLFESGVPAVLAMQGPITMGTAWEFLPALLKELLVDGNLERAAAWARWLVRERRDWWSPALFSRLEEGTIYVPKTAKTSYHPPHLSEIDQLQDYNGLPPGSYVPHHRNQVFTGRESDLTALAQGLLYGDEPGIVVGIISTQRAAAAIGLGGIGKTQLAVEFCYRYGAYFHGVHWVQASDDIRAGVANCGEKIGLRPWPDELEKQVQLTLSAWQEGSTRLVVFDDVQDSEVVSEWLPRLGNAHLLVTSRRTDWPADLPIEQVPLDMLPLEESLILLRRLSKRLEEVDDNQLAVLAERLYRLPLALDLAGRYLNERQSLTVEAYLVELNRQQGMIGHRSLVDWTKHSPTEHETSLAATFLLSWKQLDGRKPAERMAKRIFLVAGYCSANIPIPERLLLVAAGRGGENEIGHAEKGLQRLYVLGLLEQMKFESNIHPLLAEYARTIDEEQVRNALPPLVEVLVRSSRLASITEDPRLLRPVRPHIQTLAELAEPFAPEHAIKLWNLLGQYLELAAEYSAARAAYERALAIDERIFGQQHPNVARDLNNLGLVLHAQGEMEEARGAFERAVAIGQSVYGVEHPNTATFIGNMGAVLAAQGNLVGARDAFERVLEIHEEAYGLKNPCVTADINNLACVLLALGELAAARVMIERALEIDEQIYWLNHPKVARVVSNLGLVLHAQGDLAGAQAACERALSIDEQVYGPDHPIMARDVGNLGVVLQDQGDLAGARAAFERALNILEATLPDSHPRIELVRRNLQALGE